MNQSSMDQSSEAQPRSDLAPLLIDFPFLPDRVVSPIRGGRQAAEAALNAVDPRLYERSRNFLDGAVTRLSPYLRHGVLTLAEVRDHALHTVQQPEYAEKLVNELAWRDFWQRLYTLLSNGIWKDRESYKTGFSAASYATELPPDLIAGATGLHCMDSFSLQLRETGYLHNHARMWMAAYVVHWLRTRWQAGARWFLEHLLDGDPASNNLSWQWVASTFSNKPYFFNRENLERYTNGVYCRDCSLRRNCPLDGSYETIEAGLFRRSSPEPASTPIQIKLRDDGRKPQANLQILRSGAVNLLWIHTDSLNPQSSLFTDFPEAAACFVWDEAWLREDRISSKRVLFLAECLADLPARVAHRKGDLAEQVLAAATATGATQVVAQRSPDPRILAAADQIERKLPVFWLDPPRFVDDSRGFDLKRFSRYWNHARSSAMTPTG